MTCAGDQGVERFCEALSDGLARLVPAASRVVVAVSGGPDSVAMLTAWTRLAGDRRDELHVAYFDHGLRPEAAAEAAFAHHLADQHGLPFHCGRSEADLTAVPGRTVEEAARIARYAFLEETALNEDAPYVATGHTANDQVETVLAAMLRGTGIHGLGGMPAVRGLGNRCTLVRPLLRAHRDEVMRFLDAVGQSVCPDASNEDLAFTRNRIRHELLPLLRERYNPRVDQAVLRLAGLARASSRVVERLAADLLACAMLAHTADYADLALDILAGAERVVCGEAIRQLWDRQGWPRARIGREELDRIVDLVHDHSTHAWDLPHGVRAERVGGRNPVLRLTRTGSITPTT